jgi:hypothetical protein
MQHLHSRSQRSRLQVAFVGPRNPLEPLGPYNLCGAPTELEMFQPEPISRPEAQGGLYGVGKPLITRLFADGTLALALHPSGPAVRTGR